MRQEKVADTDESNLVDLARYLESWLDTQSKLRWEILGFEWSPSIPAPGAKSVRSWPRWSRQIVSRLGWNALGWRNWTNQWEYRVVPLSVGDDGLHPSGLGEVGYEPRLQMQVDRWEIIGYRAQDLAMFEGTETAGLLILKRQTSPPKLERRYMAVTGGPHRVVVNAYETTGEDGSGANLWEIAAEASNWTAGPDDSLEAAYQAVLFCVGAGLVEVMVADTYTDPRPWRIVPWSELIELLADEELWTWEAVTRGPVVQIAITDEGFAYFERFGM